MLDVEHVPGLSEVPHQPSAAGLFKEESVYQDILRMCQSRNGFCHAIDGMLKVFFFSYFLKGTSGRHAELSCCQKLLPFLLVH